MFFTKFKKLETEIFAFWVIIFETSMIQTCIAPQHDHWNLSFVKHTHVVGEKMTGKGRKTAIYQSQILVISL